MASNPDSWREEHARRGSVAKLNPQALPIELFHDIKPELNQRWAVKGLIPANGSTTIFGLPGSGKSFLALDVDLHRAAGTDWFGRRVTKSRVVYLGAEGQGGLRLRIDAWRKHHERWGNDVAFALIPAAVDLLDPTADMARVRDALDVLAQTWGGVDELTVDTLAATFGAGDENGSDMAAYVGNIAKLCDPYNCGRTIITHSPLAADAKRPRGHGSLWGSMDTVLHVTGDRDAPARRVHVLKQKDADPGADILFGLKQVEIGTDDNGDVVTSCVVEPSELDALTVKAGRRMSAKERIAYQQLERVLIESDRLPPAQIPEKVCNRYKVGKIATMSAWRAAAMSALLTPDIEPDSARKTFNRVRESLQASEIIGTWEEWVWLS